MQCYYVNAMLFMKMQCYLCKFSVIYVQCTTLLSTITCFGAKPCMLELFLSGQFSEKKRKEILLTNSLQRDFYQNVLKR